MKFPLSLALCVIAATFPAMSSAQVYQWKDSDGRTVISDTPPPGNAKITRSLGVKPGPTSSSPAAETAAAPKTIAEKDLDFKKRQQENREKADKEAKEQAAVAERKENCERAKRQQATLESGVRVATYDDKGEKRFMEDAERQQEIERAKKFVAESCK